METWEMEGAVGPESSDLDTGLDPSTTYLFYLQLVSDLFFMGSAVSSRLGLDNP